MTKKVKKNLWPVGLTVFIIAFIIAAVSVVVYSLGLNRDLVTVDYYEQEIAYQQQIDRMQRTNALSDAMQIAVRNTNQLYLEFPADIAAARIAGTIQLFRPDDKLHDRHYRVQVDSARVQWIDLAGMKRGNWRVKIAWNDGQQEYYNESPIFVN